MSTPRLSVPEATEEDLDVSLRPRRLADFVGQQAVKSQLSVSLEAATARGDALDHVLLAGPPGLGKTSLAQIIAEELGADFVQTAGPALERKGDIAALLTALTPNSVFFVDELHRLPRALEETFYPAMEDGRLPITIGQGAGAQVVTLDLVPFTLVGATTRTGLLTTPLRDRFGIQHRLDPYDPADLELIVLRSARILGAEIEGAGARAIAERARGTPRVANRLLKRVRDFAQVRGTGTIDVAAADAALELLEIDHEGLDRHDRELLQAVCTSFAGGPVGTVDAGRRGRRGGGHDRGRAGAVPPPAGLPAADAEGPLRHRPRLRAPGPRAARARRRTTLLACGSSMAHLFICPNCGNRTTATERNAGFRREARGCSKCGFAFLFELLDDYYPAPNAAFFVCDQQGRVIGCGRGSFELTGLDDERVIGRAASDVLGLQFADGTDHVSTVLEWGVRALGKPVRVHAEGDLPAKATADLFPAYDDDGGLLLILTPSSK